MTMEPDWIECNLPWWRAADDGPSFSHTIGAKPGQLLELADGQQLLIGDINEAGGVCDDCRGITHEDVITRYAVIWTNGQ